MKKRFFSVLAIVVVALVLTTGCSDKGPETGQAPAPEMSASGQASDVSQKPEEQRGTVVETIDAARYTYVRVDIGSKKIWAAAPQFQVKAGDEVVVPQGAPMRNYHSKTLDRTFDLVYFVPEITVTGADGDDGHTHQADPEAVMKKIADSAPVETDFSGIEKPEGGKTVAEIYADRDELTGNQATVRGKVVKFSPQIMGKNWIHLQDGTGEKGKSDLTVTTMQSAKVGDTAVVTGKVVKDKDFGYGYKYDVIIEDAQVTIE